MVKRMAARSLERENGCRDYAATLTKNLDERIAREAASPEAPKP